MKKVLLAACIGLIHVSCTSTQSMAEKFFPDPDVTITTPSLLVEGDSFATYDQINSWLVERSENPKMELSYIGKSTEGYDIPLIKISTESGDDAKLKVWMQGALHGNEPAGAEGLMALTDFLICTPEGAEILEKVDVTILPIANMDGYLAKKRRSSKGYDLNRDQTKFADSISIIIKKAMIAENADFAFDFHEFQPTRDSYSGLGENGASISYDALFLPSGYLNVPASFRDTSANLFQANAEKALDKFGYTHHFYFSAGKYNDELILYKGAQSPQSSSTSYMLANAVSLLVEIRGIGIGKTSFLRRTHTGFVIAKDFLETICSNEEKLRGILNDSYNSILSLSEDITVTATLPVYKEDVEFIDIEKNEKISENIWIRDALKSEAEIVRKRPQAYILDSSCTAEVDRLRILGLEVEELAAPKSLNVECYKITEYAEAEKEWENIKVASVKTQVEAAKKVFPKGSFYVDLKQKNANYAVSVLEPESKNGFVSFRVTNTALGEILKIYRVIE